MSALADVVVAEFSAGRAAAMTGMLLADFGARVVRVPIRDEPVGDPARFLWDRNKQIWRASTDPATERRSLEQLLSRSDVCLVDLPSAHCRDWGIDEPTVRATNRSLIYCHVPASELDGISAGHPEAGPLLGAALGMSAAQYSNDGGPVDPVIPHVLYAQGIWSATTVVSALIERTRSGMGQALTVSGVHSALMCMAGQFTHEPGTTQAQPPGGSGGPLPFYRLYECQDGEWLFLAALTPAFYTAAFTVLDALELLDDSRINGDLGQVGLPDNAAWAIDQLARRFKLRPRDEWLNLLQEAGCPAGPVWERAEWFRHEQVRASGLKRSFEDRALGTVEIPGVSLNLGATPAQVEPPTQGALSELEGSAQTPEERNGLDAHADASNVLRPQNTYAGTSAPGPLSGFVVLDLGSIIAGSYASSLLAELGADVVKVEPLSGDYLRALGVTFAGYNKGKRSIALDLKRPDGFEVFLRLVRKADVVIDNYRPGVLKRLGIEYEDLREIKPDIITVSVTGFGEFGPLSAAPGFDPVLQAMSGMMKAQGGTSEPVFYTLPVNDVSSAAMAGLGASLALFHRLRTGFGQRVSTSLAGQSVMMQAAELVTVHGHQTGRTGGRDFTGPSPTNSLLRVRDGWIRWNLEEGSHERLIEAGVLPLDWTGMNSGALLEHLAGFFRERTRDESVLLIREAGATAVPVRNFAELAEDRRIVGDEGVHELSVGNRRLRTIGRLAYLSRSQLHGATIVPGLGEHTVEVLREAGLDESEISTLERSGTIAVGRPFVL